MPAGEVKVTYYGNDQSSAPDQYKYKDDIVIPSSITNYTVTKIGWGAFYECTSLTSITLPNSVTSIDGFAFSGCNALTSVYFLGATPPTIGTTENSPLTNQATVYVPLQYLDNYRGGTGNNDGKINEDNLYPMLSPSTAYSTFSFDKAVDLSSIAVLWWTANKVLTAWLYLLMRRVLVRST